ENFLEDNGKRRTDYARILIIPNAGCTSCISNAESFFMDQHANKEILFIFTMISDIKLFKSGPISPYIGIDNVSVDQKDRLFDMGFHSQYPCTLKSEGSEYVSLIP